MYSPPWLRGLMFAASALSILNPDSCSADSVTIRVQIMCKTEHYPPPNPVFFDVLEYYTDIDAHGGRGTLIYDTWSQYASVDPTSALINVANRRGLDLVTFNGGGGGGGDINTCLDTQTALSGALIALTTDGGSPTPGKNTMRGKLETNSDFQFAALAILVGGHPDTTYQSPNRP